MKKYLFLLFIVVVGFTVGDVQKELIVLNWDKTVKTEKGIQVYTELNFADAGFPDAESLIPVYFRVINLDNPNQDYKFSIENPIFEEIKLSADFTDI